MRFPETSSQPFRSEPPMGCSRKRSDTSNGGEDADLARLHDNRSASAKCTPAFRALLRVAARLFDGQLDGQADQ